MWRQSAASGRVWGGRGSSLAVWELGCMRLRFNFLRCHHNWNKHTSITILWLILLWIYSNFLVRFFSFPLILSLKEVFYKGPTFLVSVYLVFLLLLLLQSWPKFQSSFFVHLLHPLQCLAFSSTLKMEKGETSEMKIPIYQATWRKSKNIIIVWRLLGWTLSSVIFFSPLRNCFSICYHEI